MILGSEGLGFAVEMHPAILLFQDLVQDIGRSSPWHIFINYQQSVCLGNALYQIMVQVEGRSDCRSITSASIPNSINSVAACSTSLKVDP